MSVVMLGEIMRDITLKQRADPRMAASLCRLLGCQDFGERILPITDQIAVEWGRIAAQRPLGDVDGLVAVTAIIRDLIVVTRNGARFPAIFGDSVAAKPEASSSRAALLRD